MKMIFRARQARHALVLSVCVLVSGCGTFPTNPILDQTQPYFDRSNDWTAGTGQIFKTKKNGLLVGIMIAIELKGGPRSFALELRRVDKAGRPDTNIFAKAEISGTEIRKNNMRWHTLSLNKPYLQEKGEELAWVMAETPRVEPHGWHNLAFQSKDPYPDGYMYWKGKIGKINYTHKEYDMAFSTLVIPAYNPFKHWWWTKKNRNIAIESGPQQ